MPSLQGDFSLQKASTKPFDALSLCYLNYLRFQFVTSAMQALLLTCKTWENFMCTSDNLVFVQGFFMTFNIALMTTICGAQLSVSFNCSNLFIREDLL